MKALCSIGAGAHEPLLALSEPTFRAYARDHGYELVTSTEADVGRPPAWAKVALLRELIEAFDLVLWIDADAVIVDGRADIARELEPDRHLALVRHRHLDQLVPNTGVMLVRSGEPSRALLERVWSNTRYVDHPWWENAALLDVLGYRLPGSLDRGLSGRVHRFARRRLGRELRPCRVVRPSPFVEGVQFLSHEWNSTYLDPASHPRIVHCLGVPVEQRLRDLSAALAGA
jgi:glycosyl transferase family (putative galactosyltransferase)